jgi:hypothetical protein
MSASARTLITASQSIIRSMLVSSSLTLTLSIHIRNASISLVTFCGASTVSSINGSIHLFTKMSRAPSWLGWPPSFPPPYASVGSSAVTPLRPSLLISPRDPKGHNWVLRALDEMVWAVARGPPNFRGSSGRSSASSSGRLRGMVEEGVITFSKAIGETCLQIMTPGGFGGILSPSRHPCPPSNFRLGACTLISGGER